MTGEPGKGSCTPLFHDCPLWGKTGSGEQGQGSCELLFHGWTNQGQLCPDIPGQLSSDLSSSAGFPRASHVLGSHVGGSCASHFHNCPYQGLQACGSCASSSSSSILISCRLGSSGPNTTWGANLCNMHPTLPCLASPVAVMSFHSWPMLGQPFPGEPECGCCTPVFHDWPLQGQTGPEEPSGEKSTQFFHRWPLQGWKDPLEPSGGSCASLFHG